MLYSIRDRGQGMVEYSLILVLVALAALVGMTLLGGLVTNLFNTINNTM